MRCRWVPASLPPCRATLPLRRLVGMWLSPPQPLVLSRRGGFILQAQGMLWVGANSAALVLPRRAEPPTPAHTATGTHSPCQALYPAQAHVVAALLQVQ